MNIIAEIGTSHEGSLEKAYSMIDACKDAGADSVKLQWVIADEILHPDTGFVALPGGNIPLYNRFKALECSFDFYEKCEKYIHKQGMKFICSPFGLKSLEDLLKLDVDGIKIASPEVNHIPLLKAISKVYGKIPVILSSGVSTLSDLETAISILTEESPQPQIKNTSDASLTLLHCITSYPAPENEYNVKCIETLSKIFGLPCGISDHSLDSVLVPVLSTAMGGKMIEKHITLSRETDGLDDPVALEPQQFSVMVHSVHQCEAIIEKYKKEFSSMNNGNITEAVLSESLNAAQKEIIRQLKNEYDEELIFQTIGNGIKKLAASEKANYGRTNRSLHYTKELKKGDVLTEENVKILRTEKILTPGISPLFYEEVLGKKLAMDIKNGEGVQFSHLMTKE